MKKQKKSSKKLNIASICKNSVNNNNIMNQKLQNGITLIALVISIIVMLILAGVSINAVVGENGVLTKAQNASIESKKAGILEAIDLELASYNIDTILSKPETTSTMLSNLMSKGLIDTVLSSTGQVIDTSKALAIPQFDDKNNYTGYTDYGVKKENYSIILSVDTTGIYKAKYGEVKVSSGGSVAAGTTVVTGNAFNSGSGTENPEEKGKFTIDNDASVMFVDEIEGELSIQVKAGKHAKVNIFKNMTLTNAGVKRSAIDIEPGGTLDLYVAEGATVTVNSGLGEDASGATPGKGGYAGIHVPEGSTLNLKGAGTIKAIGGNAGNGPTSYGIGGIFTAGGGGAGAGIGGNGGDGAKGAKGLDQLEKICEDGKKGENCGNVNIYNSVTVYAYGGAGGAGGNGGCYNQVGSGGGGGYPSAGIGGGGAGGAGSTCCAGGGGYTGGSGSGSKLVAQNGLCGTGMGRGSELGIPDDTKYRGGGYFQGPDMSTTETNINMSIILGGRASNGYTTSTGNFGHEPGNGGIGGNGGTIKVSNLSSVYAFNGNMFTDDLEEHKYKDGLNQCPIYAQFGTTVDRYVYTKVQGDFVADISKSDSKNSITQSGYVNKIYTTNSAYTSNKILNINTKLGITTNEILTNVDMSKQGVGSGAGYIEVSNGTYEIKSDMN